MSDFEIGNALRTDRFPESACKNAEQVAGWKAPYLSCGRGSRSVSSSTPKETPDPHADAITAHELRGWATNVAGIPRDKLMGLSAHEVLGVVADCIPLDLDTLPNVDSAEAKAKAARESNDRLPEPSPRVPDAPGLWSRYDQESLQYEDCTVWRGDDPGVLRWAWGAVDERPERAFTVGSHGADCWAGPSDAGCPGVDISDISRAVIHPSTVAAQRVQDAADPRAELHAQAEAQCERDERRSCEADIIDAAYAYALATLGFSSDGGRLIGPYSQSDAESRETNAREILVSTARRLAPALLADVRCGGASAEDGAQQAR